MFHFLKSSSKKKYAVISGYSRRRNVLIAKDVLERRGYTLVCAYERPPETEGKQDCLKLFKHSFNLADEAEKAKFLKLKSDIGLITCTQERDMWTHLRILEMTGHIDKATAENYRTLTNKHSLKLYLNEHAPELAIKTTDITETDPETIEESLFPGVIKSTGLSGSSFVHVAKTKAEGVSFLKQYRDQMFDNGGRFFGRPTNIVIEEFVEGREYSLNVYVDKAGAVAFCPVIRVMPAYELGEDDTYTALQYVTEELTPSELTALYGSVKKIADLFGVTNTSLHFDATLTGGLWKFFEVGLRIGGHRERIFFEGYGFSHFRNDLLNRLGEKVYLGEKILSVGIVQTASGKMGALDNISYTRTVAEPKTPLISEIKMGKIEGDVMPISKGGGTITRHIVVGGTEEKVVAECHKLRDSIKLNLVKN